MRPWLACVCVASSLIGCSSSSDDEAATKCGGATAQQLVTADKDTRVVVAGGFVYVGGVSMTDFSRVPIGGGDKEVIDPDGHVRIFAASDSGTIVWEHGTRTLANAPGPSETELRTRDHAGAERKLDAPSDAGGARGIAVDAAENVVVSSVASGSFSQMVWRWNAKRAAADVLFRTRGDIAGPWRDGGGVAWAGPTNEGALTLYHVDAEGGDPRTGPTLPADVDVIGLDERSIYAVRNGGAAGTIRFLAIDRASGASTVALDVDGTNYTPSFAMDETSFYWLVSRSDGGELSRAPKAGAERTASAAEVVASGPKIASFDVGGCSVAYVAESDDDGVWAVFARAK